MNFQEILKAVNTKTNEISGHIIADQFVILKVIAKNKNGKVLDYTSHKQRNITGLAAIADRAKARLMKEYKGAEVVVSYSL